MKKTTYREIKELVEIAYFTGSMHALDAARGRWRGKRNERHSYEGAQIANLQKMLVAKVKRLVRQRK